MYFMFLFCVYSVVIFHKFIFAVLKWKEIEIQDVQHIQQLCSSAEVVPCRLLSCCKLWKLQSLWSSTARFSITVEHTLTCTLQYMIWSHLICSVWICGLKLGGRRRWVDGDLEAEAGQLVGFTKHEQMQLKREQRSWKGFDWKVRHWTNPNLCTISTI